MLRNVHRLRVQYHQSVQDRAHRDKERAERDDTKGDGDTPEDGMEVDNANGTDVKQSKKNPTELPTAEKQCEEAEETPRGQ